MTPGSERPSPEQMLARLKTEGGELARRTRGRLTVFFGYAAGVGKTYAMLQAARKLKADGVDVVVGYVEPHGRPETEVLLEGLEHLPVLHVPYRAATLREFDLDAALARNPAVLLVDELAHTNAPGLRHAKRWQDVDELLKAGIDVLTTVNVQHVESLNDVVAQISGIVVRETVPDEILERADEVVLVDLLPDELLARLKQGKVYIPERAAQALASFFRKQNLLALRELALRELADRVHVDVEAARSGAAAAFPWPTNERLLVCVGPSPTSAKVIRATKRLADTLRAPWVAIHVETPRDRDLGERARARLQNHLRLAERLGGEVVRLTGEDVVRETVEYARARNVTKIVIGKSDQPRARLLPAESLVTRLLRDSGNVDVFVVRGEEERESPPPTPAPRRPALGNWLWTGAVLAAVTAVAWAFFEVGFPEANIVMAFLLAVIIVAARFGTRPAIAASVLAVLLFDVLFVQPYYTFAVHELRYLFTFGVMLAVALLVSTLVNRTRRQAEVARRNERRTEALYRLSRRLTGLTGRQQLITETERIVSEVFNVHAVLFVPDRSGKIRPVLDSLAAFAASATEVAAAQWVFDRGQPAGLGTDTLPSLAALYLPLATPRGVVGVLSLQPGDPQALADVETRQLLETYCTQIAFAIERDRLAEEFQEARVQMETEKLRSSLLSSVSHDLRTPLAVVAGASSSLLQSWDTLSPETRRELLDSIVEESDRLSRLVDNLLHMTRFSSGAVTVHKEWHPVEEVIGSALRRVERRLHGRKIDVHLPRDRTVLGCFDALLVEQALINLLDNAAKYSPDAASIEVEVSEEDSRLAIQVADRGRGLTPEDRERMFEKFYRGAEGKSDRRGAGLGLAICKAVALAHGGTITAENRPGGGAVFRVVLPTPSPPPRVPIEEEAGTA